jgi:(E)-4-hydroxy-3-methyl-but-2-enyl pyrophosphate reductase
MKINIAKNLGFCKGVANAYKLAIKAASSGTPTYMLGYLVHNQNVIDELNQKGVITLKTLKDLPKNATGNLIISAHGLSPDQNAKALATGLTVIDTTCPWVKKPQMLAKQMVDEGYHLVIVGDKDHTEVRGVMGWGYDKADVVDSLKDLKKIASHEKIAVIAQTTQSRKHYDEIINELAKKTKELTCKSRRRIWQEKAR